MTQHTHANGELNWLLDNLVERVPETLHAIVLSEDGLLMAMSNKLARDEAEHLSAVASGLQSLARGVGQRFDGGRVRQTVVEMDRLFLFVTAAGQGARLAVLASDQVDAGLMAYELNLLVKQVGQYLSAAPRVNPSQGDHGEHA
ncbi:dynein regulation protein LC7 [Carbonactinospora thermoautotrophica]|uniref:Dynein regulation protein LC7 n=1 Tax=Carbonactinospora thermoautotrophica TaxID=1469144 RepID=A0A132N6B1_9ACTN|nr:roadblock/LC7 domain-containing protein [Carbonactinospora thermoautotrophica]KWX01398.1 Roadblock/LC7 family protein [Carbonactinospora thermoautotrophica]KWX05668.1 dynein regulation protein LC7 [Carbonactinospora thermoautotrophica]KWX09664.1 dynein regulation protein LC7 [Carbonactinospora thermoautotrophica]MCX9192845.1 dynein regulation protein LC7 [Carbonactinospora thermoautotrophica]